MTSASQARQIMSAARQQLAEAGATGLSLGAVAGGSGRGLIEVETVFEHRDDLLTALIVDAYNASGAAMETAGLLIFELFGRAHDSISDLDAFFSYGIAVAAESIGLAVPRGDQNPPAEARS